MSDKLWHHMIYGKVSKDFYSQNRELLDKTNYMSVKIAYCFATLFFAALTVVALVYSVVDNTRVIYLMGTVVCVILLCGVEWWLPKHIRWTRVFYFIFEIIVFFAAIMAGTFFSPDDLAVQFFVFLIILPMLYIERPLNSILMTIVATVAFCIVSCYVKWGNSYLAEIDLLNAAFCLAASIVFIYYVRSMHLKNIQAAVILQMQSEMDGLTGVLNKVSTESACENYLQLMSDTQNASLLIVDIDDFKSVNDTLGHKQGDMLLKQIGYILRGIFREGDIVGRVGGDEFMVLMKNVHDPRIAEIKAEKILREISIIFGEYSTRHFGCSIGIASNKMQGMHFSEMYSQADKALYHAKNHGKGRYVTYEEEASFTNNGLPLMLVVDDSEVSRAVLRTCFDGEYNILEAEDGQKGLGLLEEYANKVSIVLLDLEMPVMTGYEVLKYMKKSERLKKIPVLIITAHEKNELLALELGADDMIAKPYDPMVVKKRVANAIAKK